MNKQAEYRARLETDGAIRHGHFVYNSGKHARTYVNKAVGCVRSSNVMNFAWGIAEYFHRHRIETLVAPELGAVTFMAHVQRQLVSILDHDIFAVVAEKVREPHPDPVEAAKGYRRETGEFEIGRDQARFVEGKRVLLIEDVLSTGGSAKRSSKPVRSAGGIIVGVGALWNQGDVQPEDIGIGELFALINDEMVIWDEKDCPLCHERAAVNTEVGKGKSFLLTERARMLGLKAAA